MLTQKNPSSDNPIRIFLVDLGTSTKTVTIPLLTELSDLFKLHGIKFATYGSVFDMLKFLESRGCIVITPKDTGEYEITGLYNYGK